MGATRQRTSDVVMDCLALSDGTIATLTGHNKYEDIDRVQAELVQLALEMPTATSWMEVWNAYIERRRKSYDY
jgi:hypothetical protein